MYKIYFSNQFYYFLTDIKEDNLLARFLLDYNACLSSEFNMIDVSPEDKATFLSTEKIDKLYQSYTNTCSNIYNFFDHNRTSNGIIYNNNLRTEIKIGRLIRKIFEQENFASKFEEYRQDYRCNKTLDELVELLTNAYKCQTKRIFDENFNSKLILLSGEDIRKYYNQDNYLPGKGSLHDSCMRYSKCTNYLDIYTENPDVCQMLVFMEDNKIGMRALVWKLSNGKTYMDRIYSARYSDSKIFIDYAKKNNWLYCETIFSSSEVNELEVNLQNVNFDYYPYMDTFHYISILDKKLVRDCNNFTGPSEVRRLRSQEGGWSTITIPRSS
jgi:hypothetical protein